jgi:hypothetical protein
MMMMISAFAGTCEGCYVYAALTMHFAMKIDNYKLLAIEPYLSGDMNCNLQVDELQVTKSVSASFSKLIMTYVSAVVPIKHEVGLATLSISATVPMCIGWTSMHLLQQHLKQYTQLQLVLKQE